jgi:hypothetical protein
MPRGFGSVGGPRALTVAVFWVAPRRSVGFGSDEATGWYCLPVAEDWTVERHLADADPAMIELYERLVELVDRCGPFTYSVSKTAITFKGTRRGFAGTRPRRKYLGGYFDVMRRIDDPRISRVTPYTKRLFVHRWRVHRMDQLDDEFAGWIAEAYAVGNGAHLDEGRDRTM